MNQSGTWFAIVNPRAGGGKGEADWPHIKSLLEKNGIDFHVRFTEHSCHATELAISSICKGYRNILVIGGDGTLNEAVNGIFLQDREAPATMRIGVISVGTGNDWQKMYSIPASYKGKVDTIKTGRIFMQDVGKVEFSESGMSQSRYFVNAAGLGFDAAVTLSTNELKENGRKGTLLYMLCLLKTLLKYKSSFINFSIDNLKYEEDILSITLGIGRYNGGGMMQVPNAIPDDGLFDITVIKNISRGSVLRNISRLYNGTILGHPRIHGYQGKEISVTSIPPVTVEVDGESLGTSPFHFSIIPKSLRVVVGADFNGVEIGGR